MCFRTFVLTSFYFGGLPIKSDFLRIYLPGWLVLADFAGIYFRDLVKKIAKPRNFFLTGANTNTVIAKKIRSYVKMWKYLFYFQELWKWSPA